MNETFELVKGGIETLEIISAALANGIEKCDLSEEEKELLAPSVSRVVKNIHAVDHLIRFPLPEGVPGLG